jgi:hypothetical protein
MTEIITNEETGLIIPIENPQRLTQALLRLVDDPALRRRFGEALHRVVQDRFLVTSYVRNLESAYDDLLAMPRSALGWRHALWKGQVTMYGRWIAEVAARRLAGVSKAPATVADEPTWRGPGRAFNRSGST